MPGITLIAHNIRSAHNVGAIFRTAEGFGVNKIILSGYSPYPAHDDDKRLPHESRKVSQQIHKTALGAELIVPFERYPVLDSWLATNQAGPRLPIVALEQAENSIPINKFNCPDEIALLLGEEVKGIADTYMQLADYTVEIPMKGQKESFNVSVATGIALYALTL